MINTQLRTPGAYIIDKCVLETNTGIQFDFSKLIESFVISDNMFSAGSTLTLSLVDTGEFFNKANIKGGEKISLSFFTDFNGTEPSSEIVYAKDFFVRDIENIKLSEESENITLTINAVSEIFLVNTTHRVKRSYSRKISNIVERIFKDVLKLKTNIDVIDTDAVYNFTVPNWRPLETIEKITRRAFTSSVKDGSTYVFYEDKAGHHFKPIESFIDAPRAKTYRKQLMGVDSINRDFFAYNSYNVTHTNDIIQMTLNGLYGGQLEVLNMTEKSFKSFKYDLKAKRSTKNRLNDVDINKVVEGADLKTTFRASNANNIIFNNSMLSRESTLNLINNFVLDIDVPGFSGHKIGDKIFVEIDSFADFSSDLGSKPLNYLNGYYIIREIKHIIDKDYYRNILTLIKDSYHASK